MYCSYLLFFDETKYKLEKMPKIVKLVRNQKILNTGT